jgi:hypothetical protein
MVFVVDDGRVSRSNVDIFCDEVEMKVVEKWNTVYPLIQRIDQWIDFRRPEFVTLTA